MKLGEAKPISEARKKFSWCVHRTERIDGRKNLGRRSSGNTGCIGKFKVGGGPAVQEKVEIRAWIQAL